MVRSSSGVHLLTALYSGVIFSTAFANIDPPQQIHIAAAARSSFRVTWKTQTTTPSRCSFGPSENDLSLQATGEDGYQYLTDHGYHHTVLLDNLPMDSVYYYACGDGSVDNTSPVIQFKTAPSPDKTVKLSILGDWGYLDSVQRPMDLPVDGIERNWTAVLTRELLESFKDEEKMDAVWVVGDLGYVDDAFAHKNYTFHDGYEPCYDGWVQWQQNYSSIMPFMVTPGNHESECKIEMICLYITFSLFLVFFCSNPQPTRWYFIIILGYLIICFVFSSHSHEMESILINKF
jgi:acid phosphatase type 7